MKRVFICSPLRPIGGNSMEDNIDLVRRLCRAAAFAGVAPYAPHLYIPQFLNDTLASERDLGLAIGKIFLGFCEEVWVYDGLGISTGMHGEIGVCSSRGIPIVNMPKPFIDVPAKRPL